jgi:hypothetical protein
MVIKQRHLSRIVGLRRVLRRRLSALVSAGWPPDTSGAMSLPPSTMGQLIRLVVSQPEHGEVSSRRRWRRCYLYLHILQHDRLQRTPSSRFEQCHKVTVRDTMMEADVCLDCWPAKMSVKDGLSRLQAHSLVVAVEQLAQALDCTKRQLRQPGP